MEAYTIVQFERVGRNLYRTGAGYWRLFAGGVTPNGCWLYGSMMVELVDIDASTGADVFGPAEVCLGEGTTPGCMEYVKKS